MPRKVLRSLARGARHLPDRVLHPWRRRALERRLTLRPPPRVVLFVCDGNMCRSPYAAAVARRLLPPAIRVESAGFIGADRTSPPEAVAVAAERGLDLAPHRSRLLATEDLRDSDLILVMDRRQRRRLVGGRPQLAARVELLGDLDPLPISRRGVPDPVEQPADVFRACFDRIDRCVGALHAALRYGDDH